MPAACYPLYPTGRGTLRPRAASSTCRLRASATSRRSIRRACRSSASASTSASARPSRRSRTATTGSRRGAGDAACSSAWTVEPVVANDPFFGRGGRMHGGDPARAGPQVRAGHPDLRPPRSRRRSRRATTTWITSAQRSTSRPPTARPPTPPASASAWSASPWRSSRRTASSSRRWPADVREVLGMAE